MDLFRSAQPRSHFSLKTPEAICALYDHRRNAPDQQWRAEAAIIKDLLNGDLWRPTSERLQDGGTNEFAATANTALSNLESMVTRICSTVPNIKFVPVNGTKGADDKARLRRLASLGFWDQNEVAMKDRKRVRWLRAFGSGPMQITTSPKGGKPIPRWVVRDPLMTYTSPATEDTGFVPDNCVFAYKRTYSWLQQNYPLHSLDVYADMANRRNRKCNPDTMFEIIEYLDAEERVLILRHRDGATSEHDWSNPTQPKTTLVELERYEHRIGVCPIVNPTLITVDRLRSPYIDNVGMQIMRDKLMALEYIFAERTVFAEQWVVKQQGSAGGIDVAADGPRGVIGEISGASLETVQLPQNFAGTQMIDRLEREARVSNSSPAEFNGESASNIRTGVRGNNIVQNAVSFTLQEHQEVLALAKESELRTAAAIDKTYYNKLKTFYFSGKGIKDTKVDYTPGEIWESDEVHVFYSSAGADINAQVISGGQRIAQGTMSKRTFMEMDPMVEDAETESDAIIAEQLNQSILAEFLQPGGVLDVVAKAEVAELVKSNKLELSAAVAEVQKRRQEQQAAKDAEGNPTGVDPMAPEAQPGIAGEAAMAGIAGPSGDQNNLASVLGALRRPQLTVNGA